MEYFFFGHDTVCSSLADVDPLKRKDPTFAVFFGGAGDCRHVFATLLDLKKKFYPDDGKTATAGGGSAGGRSGTENSNATPTLTDVRFEINDIHGFCFARFVVMCYLSQKFLRLHRATVDMSSGSGASRKHASVKAGEMSAALQYWAFEGLLPRECWEDVMQPAIEQVRDLFLPLAQGSQSETAAAATSGQTKVASLFPWLECDVTIAKAIVEATKQWLRQANVVEAKAAQHLIFNPNSAASALTPAQLGTIEQMMETRIEERRRELQESVKHIDAARIYDSMAGEHGLRTDIPLVEKQQMLIKIMYGAELDKEKQMREILGEGGPIDKTDASILDYILEKHIREVFDDLARHCIFLQVRLFPSAFAWPMAARIFGLNQITRSANRKSQAGWFEPTGL